MLFFGAVSFFCFVLLFFFFCDLLFFHLHAKIQKTLKISFLFNFSQFCWLWRARSRTKFFKVKQTQSDYWNVFRQIINHWCPWFILLSCSCLYVCSLFVFFNEQWSRDLTYYWLNCNNNYYPYLKKWTICRGKLNANYYSCTFVWYSTNWVNYWLAFHSF